MRATAKYDEKLYFEKIISDIENSSTNEEKKEILIAEVDKEAKKKFKEKVSNTLFITITILFIISYIVLAIFIYEVFCSERKMIMESFMEAEHRSINSTTVSIMITATLTQIGITFGLLAKFAFSSKKEEKAV